MGKTIVKEDEEIELTHVDEDLEVHDGAKVIVSKSVDKLVIGGKLISSGDVIIEGSVKTDEIRHSGGYLEIEGDVEAQEVKVYSRGTRNGSKLDVIGSLTCNEAEIEGGLEVDKDLVCDDLEVNGACTVHGTAKVNNYEINGAAKHGMDLSVGDLEVNGSLKAQANVTVKTDFQLGGSAKIEGILEAPEIDIGGSLSCYELLSNSVEIGGSAKLEISKIDEKLNVSGSFKCTESMIAPKVNCNGACGFGDESSIKNLTINGSTKVGDNFKFETIKVNGSFKIDGSAFGDELVVNGSTAADGDIKLEGNLEINGSVNAIKLQANEIKIDGGLTVEEASAKFIYVGDSSRVRGILKADTVELDDSARVDHIIANKVKLGADSKVGKLEAKEIDADPSARYK